MGRLANQRHERFAQALAQGKSASEAYVLAGYKANDGNASRLKGNERISARVQEIVGRAAERAEIDVERILRELAAIAFSNITKAVTWRCEEGEDGQRVKVLPVPSDKLDEVTVAAISRCRKAPRARFASRCTTSWRPLWSWVSTSECSTSARRTLTPFMPSRISR